MKSSRSFLLVGNGPYANHGCEAIVRGTVAIITRAFGPDCRFANASFGDPHLIREQAQRETDARIDSLCVDKPSWHANRYVRKVARRLRVTVPDRLTAMRSHLKSASAALEVGGDNYSLSYGLPVLMRYVNLDRYLWRHGLPVALWGASVGPFSEDVEIEKMMAVHLRRLSLILARETGTVSYLASIGVEENVRLVADPAFAMEPSKPEMTDELARMLEQNPIGLNISPLVAQYRSDAAGTWADFARECIERLLEQDLGPVLLVPHVMVAGHNDYDFLHRAASGLPGWGERVAILPPTFTAAEYKWAISRLRALIAARTHTTIAAFSTGVPTVSIAYSAKAIGINKDIYGHADWCLPIAELTPDSLIDRTKQLLRRQDTVRSHLAESAPLMRDRAYAAGQHLADIVSASSCSRSD